MKNDLTTHIFQVPKYEMHEFQVDITENINTYEKA